MKIKRLDKICVCFETKLGCEDLWGFFSLEVFVLPRQLGYGWKYAWWTAGVRCCLVIKHTLSTGGSVSAGIFYSTPPCILSASVVFETCHVYSKLSYHINKFVWENFPNFLPWQYINRMNWKIFEFEKYKIIYIFMKF